MIRTTALAVLLAASFSAFANEEAHAKVDLAKAKQIAESICVACHGADGNSALATNPNLAGQIPEYLQKQLSNFRSVNGKPAVRENPIMGGMAAGLAEEDLKSLAVYFSQQKLKPATPADEKLVAEGQKLWRTGDFERGVPACAGCHGVAFMNSFGRFAVDKQLAPLPFAMPSARRPALPSLALLGLLAAAPVSTLWGQATESPATAARGTWLLESDTVSVFHERSSSQDGSFVSRSVLWGNLLLSRGLTERLDVQVGFDGWLADGTSPEAPTRHGHGDAAVRLKWNFVGTEGEGFAAALLPQLRVPISSEGMGARSCEPGLLVPFSLPLDSHWLLGGMGGFDSSHTDERGWILSWIGSCYLNRSLGKDFNTYLEFTGSGAFRAPHEPFLQGGAGMTWQASKALLCELALYRALNSATPDWNPVLRFSYSF